MKKYVDNGSDRNKPINAVIVCVPDTQQLIEEDDDHDDIQASFSSGITSPMSIPKNDVRSFTQSCSCPAQTHFASW